MSLRNYVAPCAGGQMQDMEAAGPSYQRVARDLSRQIAEGKIAVGQPIPSTKRLMESYDASSTVVRHAVTQLREAGVLVGYPGKGVYVQATPEQAEATQREAGEPLAEQVGRLKAELHELTERVDGFTAVDAGEVAALRGEVGELRAHLMDLCAQMGLPSPSERAGQTRRAV